MIPEVEEARAQLAEMCRRHNVLRLEIFGSATGPAFDAASSDIDFLVEFGEFPPGGYFEHYFALLEELETLFNRPVDLVVARAVTNPYFLEVVNRSRKLLYAA